MAANCGISFGLCAVRITQVDAQGNVVGTADNSYVTDNPISISITPNITTGETIEVRNGCGCNITSFKVNDTFNWFDFTFNMATLEPEMKAMLLGSNTIADGADVVGMHFNSALDCNDDEPAVALEYWTKHIFDGAQDATYPWIHWTFPKTVWQLGDNTFENAAAQPTLVGFSRSNALWGSGPYGDGPPDGSDTVVGSWFKTDVSPPTAACATATATPGS